MLTEFCPIRPPVPRTLYCFVHKLHCYSVFIANSVDGRAWLIFQSLVARVASACPSRRQSATDILLLPPAPHPCTLSQHPHGCDGYVKSVRRWTPRRQILQCVVHHSSSYLLLRHYCMPTCTVIFIILIIFSHWSDLSNPLLPTIHTRISVERSKARY